MENFSDPGISLDALGLEDAREALRAEMLRSGRLDVEARDLRQQLKESRRKHTKDILSLQRHIRILQEQLDEEVVAPPVALRTTAYNDIKNDRTPVDGSTTLSSSTPAETRRLCQFQNCRGAVLPDPIQTSVWDNQDRSYHFRPISPAKNLRTNNIPAVGIGKFLQLAGYLFPSSCHPGGDPDDDPRGTRPRSPNKGYDAIDIDGAGNLYVAGDPSSWDALPSSARPIPICYGVDWTRNHVSPENGRRSRHLPWLARYPNGGVHLYHPVATYSNHKREVAQIMGRLWPHATKHKFHRDHVGQEEFVNNFPKYSGGIGTVPAALRSFLRNVESHSLIYGVFVPALETIMYDAQLGNLFTSLPVHIQMECVDVFDLLLYQCFKNDNELCAEFSTLFSGHTRSGYHVIYELAVAAQLPMLSLVGFEAVHTRPVMDGNDTIAMYTARWKSWFHAADDIGWIYSDRWFLNEYVRGLHRSLGEVGLLLKGNATANCRNENSAYSDKFSPNKIMHTFVGIVASHCRVAVDISAIPARMLASSLPNEWIFQVVENNLPLAAADIVI